MTKTFAYVLITTTHGFSQEVASALMDHEEIQNVHELFGQYDLIAHVLADNNKDLSNFVHSKIIGIPNVESTETLVVSDIIHED